MGTNLRIFVTGLLPLSWGSIVIGYKSNSLTSVSIYSAIVLFRIEIPHIPTGSEHPFPGLDKSVWVLK